MPSAHSVNPCSPPPFQATAQPQIYELCRWEARCRWSHALVPAAAQRLLAPGLHPQPTACPQSAHSACCLGGAPTPSVPSVGTGAQLRCWERARPSPALTGSLVQLSCRSQGSWEEADMSPCLLAEPMRAPSAGDAGACSKAVPAWVGKHINHGLFSRWCPFLCRNQCLA